jgi:signal transduction histidine kinase
VNTSLTVASAVALSSILAVALLGLSVLYALRRRSITTVLTGTVLVPVLSLAVGVLAMTALAPPRALDQLAIPVGVAVGLSIVIAVVVAKIIMIASVALRRAVELLGDGTEFVPPRAPTAELAALAAALDDAQHRLHEARRREAELERSRHEMLVGLGHDLRTPLARLRSIVEALQEEGPSDPAVLDSYLGVLQSQTMRLNTLIDEVVELTRITSGLVDPVFAPLALDDLVSNALADANPHARQRGVALSGDAPPGITVNADVRLMTRVLDNMVDNAIANTAPGNGVHISAASRSDGVVLEVQDSCGGIPEENIHRLFNPGYRGDTSRGATDGAGFGLGLAIARGLAEANGARMSVQNVGDGCRFSVLFAPVTPAQVRQPGR